METTWLEVDQRMLRDWVRAQGPDVFSRILLRLLVDLPAGEAYQNVTPHSIRESTGVSLKDAAAFLEFAVHDGYLETDGEYRFRWARKYWQEVTES